ncbi:PQQ-dependent sugar dehydrogenase [Pengzhenrongella sp.]|jgi:glucose/arabinose dehydrogenase|uniref:PQQ-dependent sugar dehydrogenase n=1 Tax=Pengzhenrongella sp. TaxID=2888820 RepID=UPI002F92AEED
MRRQPTGPRPSAGPRREQSVPGQPRRANAADSLLICVIVVIGLSACTPRGGGAPPPETSAGGSFPAPSATPSGPGTPPATTEPSAVAVTSQTDLVKGLDAPWGLAFLPDGSALLTLRDAARVLLVAPGGTATTDVGGPGADYLTSTTTPNGEAGLLGVALAPAGGPHAGEVYLYRTTADGNEVDRAALDRTDPAHLSLGTLHGVLDGIPAAGNHDGGRLAFGPDGYLYIGTGDAADPPTAQDPDSLAGKILRITSDGDPAPGNPFPGSPVWTLGHRNVEGLDWAPDGRMFASEFGQDTFDELNQIVPGANYGWPEVEGAGGAARGFTDPLITWSPADASPSGLTVTFMAVYVAALRGERLWRIPLAPHGVGQPQALLTGELGRLRAVEQAPDGSVWVLTNNTDGRGTPHRGDDRIVRITLG